MLYASSAIRLKKGLFQHLVHGLSEIQNLPGSAQIIITSWTVIRCAQIIIDVICSRIFRTHECGEHFVHHFDEIHNGFWASYDLSVQWSLNIVLKKDTWKYVLWYISKHIKNLTKALLYISICMEVRYFQASICISFQ